MSEIYEGILVLVLLGLLPVVWRGLQPRRRDPAIQSAKGHPSTDASLDLRPAVREDSPSMWIRTKGTSTRTAAPPPLDERWVEPIPCGDVEPEVTVRDADR